MRALPARAYEPRGGLDWEAPTDFHVALDAAAGVHLPDTGLSPFVGVYQTTEGKLCAADRLAVASYRFCTAFLMCWMRPCVPESQRPKQCAGL
jgi:hypothetical protein